MFKGTYRRNWEGDYHCTPTEVKAMLRDQIEDTMDILEIGPEIYLTSFLAYTVS
ncbi:MAG: hypothetical protein HFJ10_02725 [Lachnospiraceae bacterium]|nr:hypothetical protein [Lachnospiraceae bacterium]